MSERVTSVAVVGRDAPLWLAAASVQRALGRTGVRVHAVELPSQLTEVDVYAAPPTLAAMHRLLGLDEQLLFKLCRAVPMVGQRFSNWARNAPPYVIAYDDEAPAGELPFTSYWAKAALEGLRVGFEDFSLGSACARLNAVPVVGEDPGPLSASYGYHLDASAYAVLIKQLALRLGVEIAGSSVREVVAAGDVIEAINLADGTRLAADLYIDASGQDAVLISRLASAQFESWSQWLPCNRIFAAGSPRMAQLPAFSHISAFAGGWIGQFPLQDRTAITAVYDTAVVDDGEIAELSAVITRSAISGDAVLSALRTGRQLSPWIGNCVAIGETAVALDPVGGLPLHVTHACISHLMTLFPATAGEYQEADAYNRAIGSFGANLRDFQAAHYRLNRRFDEPMWDRVRDVSAPAGLQRKIDMFAARTMIPLGDEESFDEQSWAALLLGCGVRPQGYDPRVDGIADQVILQKVQQRLRDVASIARQMPGVEQFLALEQPSPALVGG